MFISHISRSNFKSNSLENNNKQNVNFGIKFSEEFLLGVENLARQENTPLIRGLVDGIKKLRNVQDGLNVEMTSSFKLATRRFLWQLNPLKSTNITDSHIPNVGDTYLGVSVNGQPRHVFGETTETFLGNLYSMLKRISDYQLGNKPTEEAIPVKKLLNFPIAVKPVAENSLENSKLRIVV